MCGPVTMMAMGTSASSTALDVTRQLQQAAQQRADYGHFAAQQRNEVDVAEARARQAEAAGGIVLRRPGKGLNGISAAVP